MRGDGGAASQPSEMTKLRHLVVALAVVAVWLSGCAPSPRASGGSGVGERREYFPPAGAWERRAPGLVGMNERLLGEAIAWAQTQETDWPADFSKQEETFGRLLGPIPKSRAGTNGVVLRHGYIVAEFGDVEAVDPTYSVAKSYLSTLLGLTLDRGMIAGLDQPVGALVHDGGYDSLHNAKVTWRQHVTQTSEWEGAMFGKTSTFLGREEYGQGAMKPREIREPGAYYEYNDVRINQFSMSMLRLWKRPLASVLMSEIMDPIGASETWTWIPYDSAMVEVDGKMMASVSGGTRWGGGLWISTLDHARFGLLMLREGDWNGRQVISREWVREATRPLDARSRPAGAREDYAYLWWLNNTGRWAGVPTSSYSAQGAGDNTIWIDHEHDIVVVWRWHKGSAQGEFYRRILAAIRDDERGKAAGETK